MVSEKVGRHADRADGKNLELPYDHLPALCSHAQAELDLRNVRTAILGLVISL